MLIRIVLNFGRTSPLYDRMLFKIIYLVKLYGCRFVGGAFGNFLIKDKKNVKNPLKSEGKEKTEHFGTTAFSRAVSFREYSGKNRRCTGDHLGFLPCAIGKIDK